jgi:carbonic anhydrase
MVYGKFATLITCMDGRVQRAGYDFMVNKFSVDYADIITEPGPNKILAENNEKHIINNIFNRIDISVSEHKSHIIAIAGHYDCAGNPVNKLNQDIHTKQAVLFIKSKYPNKRVIGLWIEKDFKTVEIVHIQE